MLLKIDDELLISFTTPL